MKILIKMQAVLKILQETNLTLMLNNMMIPVICILANPDPKSILRQNCPNRPITAICNST